MWKEGTSGVNAFSEEKETVICHYWAKVYDEGSQFGIDGGRISKLMIKINGKITCNYDRGWDIEPTDEATKIAYRILMEENK